MHWEIDGVKFTGVNHGPQAAARFTTADAGDVQAKIAITRIRYGVIRPCGPLAGVNPLQDCQPVTAVSLAIERAGNIVKLSWPSEAVDFVLHADAHAHRTAVGVPNVVVEVIDGRNVVTLTLGAGMKYFRVGLTPGRASPIPSPLATGERGTTVPCVLPPSTGSHLGRGPGLPTDRFEPTPAVRRGLPEGPDLGITRIPVSPGALVG